MASSSGRQLLGQTWYLMLINVELTFRIFIGMADPVPRKTISGYWLLFSVENTSELEPAFGHVVGKQSGPIHLPGRVLGEWVSLSI